MKFCGTTFLRFSKNDSVLARVSGGYPLPNCQRKVKEFKKKRDQKQIKEVLTDCYHKAKMEDENLMYPIIAALKADATMQEIAGAMRMAYDYPYDPYDVMESPI